LRSISAAAFEPDREVFWKIAGTVTVIEDITLFRQIDRIKSDFINMVTHELRSPLAAIRQINTVFLDGMTGPLNEKQKDFVKRVINKTDGLLELINDLLNMANMESSTRIEHETSTDIARIIEDIVTLIRPEAASQNVDISFTFHNLKPVKTDPKKIELIVNNLISNAVKYSPGGGMVSIISNIEDDILKITVEDQGIGIPMEEQAKIFNRFYRVKNPQTRKVTGTGLGLSMVKEIVESFGGKICVTSIQDKGTTFTISIPIIL
jgi:signal transduction histidine kinase